MNFTKLIFVLALTLGLSFTACGKKDDSTTTQKKDSVTQTKQTTQTNQTTQKMDTTKPKTDTSVTKKDDEPNTVIMETSMGNMTIELYPDDAPKHVANFKKLVDSKFYEGTQFHRIIAG